jgi:hypothetical protein
MPEGPQSALRHLHAETANHLHAYEVSDSQSSHYMLLKYMARSCYRTFQSWHIALTNAQTTRRQVKVNRC